MSKKWLAIFMVIVLYSCKKDTLQTDSVSRPSFTHPDVSHFPVTVNVDLTQPGYVVPLSFEGLSFETSILSENPEYLNENNATLVQLVKNLGFGVLRIGGNSSDVTNWTGSARTDPTRYDLLTTTDVDRLSDFSKAVGWPVVFGLNLANKDIASADDEAKYVSSTFGNRLLAFQNGNEPDAFTIMGLRKKPYDYVNYHAEWDGYYSVLHRSVPSAVFAGPDVTPFDNSWISLFAQDEAKDIKMLDGHYYVTGPASLPQINYNDILTDNSKLADYLSTLSTVSQEHHIPFRISECNSVFGKGKPGVSDVFASTLWALDFMWAVAESHGQGINFHGGNSSFIYSPIADVNGSFEARPEYYAMLAFKYGAVGQAILPVKVNNSKYNLSVHAAITHNNTYTVTVINKEEKSSFDITIQLSKSASTAKVTRLIAPSVTSADVTIGGQSVKSDGTIAAAKVEKYTVKNDSFVLHMPAASAAVVTIN